jgi:hypothetical protein
VALGGGRKGRLVVCEGAAVDEMAREFVAAHALQPAAEPKLRGLIAGAVEAHAKKRAAQAAAQAEQAAAQAEQAAAQTDGAAAPGDSGAT